MSPGSPEQRLEERLDRLVSEMDELLIISCNSPIVRQAIETAKDAIAALEARHAA